MTMQEQFEKSLRHELESVQRRIDSLNRYPFDQIAEAFPEANISLGTFSGIQITFPMKWDLVARWKEWVQANHPDWKSTYDNQLVWDDTKKGGYFVDYYVNDHYDRLDVAFRTEIEGSTCVLHEIGQKSVPVYEMTCPEGATEQGA